VLSQSVMDILKMLQVFCPILVEDGDIIQIYHHKRIGEIPQYIVHQSHKMCWSICQPKGHEYPFEKTLFGLESNLPYITSFYWDLVVAIL
jgi:hypothetical protein